MSIYEESDPDIKHIFKLTTSKITVVEFHCKAGEIQQSFASKWTSSKKILILGSFTNYDYSNGVGVGVGGHERSTLVNKCGISRQVKQSTSGVGGVKKGQKSIK